MADETSGEDHGRPGADQPHRGAGTLDYDAGPRKLDRRYSKYVRGLKVVLPSTAAIVVVLVLAWPQLHLQDRLPDPESLRIRPQDAADLTVLGVRYAGTDSQDRPFTVTAASTRQARDDADRVALEKPEADMTLTGGRRIALQAEQGVFDRETSRLDLSGAVRFLHDDGYELRTDQAQIDFRDGLAQGDGPVVADGPVAKARADGFKVLDRGRTVLFTGKASMQFKNEPAEDGS